MKRCIAIALLGVACGAAAQPAERQPVRFDNWLYFQHNIDGTDRWQYRPRFFIPFAVANGWTFTQRIDLPMYLTDKPGAQNPDGGWNWGIGDWFVEEYFRSPEIAKNLRVQTSLRFVFPTGGQAPFGSSQYQWAPSLSASYAMPDAGITLIPLARYFMSYHATLPGAGRIRRLDLYPEVGLKFSPAWTLSFYPENAISYNEVSRKWFVPIDMMVLLHLDRTTDFGFGGAYALKKDDPQYQYIINARYTIRF